MADTPEAIELQRRARRRLVGAIALVVFVVIALPIIFDREPKPISQDLTIQIPSQDSGRFSTRVLPPQADPKPEAAAVVGADPKGVAAKTSPAPAAPATPAPAAYKSAQADKAGAPAKTAEVPKTDSSSDAAGTVAKAALAGVAKAEPTKGDASKGDANKAGAPKADAIKPATAAAAKPAAGGTPADSRDVASKARPEAPAPGAAGESFVVPLGLFRNPDNVKKVRGWVANAGFKSFTEPAPETNTAKGDGVKVMAGPFPTREAAEKAHDRLKARGVDVGPVVGVVASR